MGEAADLEVGDFSVWMSEIQGAIRGARGSDVPCGGCTACCTSYQFIHIGPDETDTLAHLPAELLFPAPGLPRGHVVMGYDERGHCPMLVDDKCSIYAHRPVTCRTYDCRIFPAAEVDVGVDDPDKIGIARQARRWRFGFPTGASRDQRDAVRGAARFLAAHPGLLPDGIAPTSATQRAVLAIEIHDLFLRRDSEAGQDTTLDQVDPDSVRAEVVRRREAGVVN